MSFTYLVSEVNSGASFDDEIINSVSKTTEVFSKLYHSLWIIREIKLDTKVKFYKVAILLFCIAQYRKYPLNDTLTN